MCNHTNATLEYCAECQMEDEKYLAEWWQEQGWTLEAPCDDSVLQEVSFRSMREYTEGLERDRRLAYAEADGVLVCCECGCSPALVRTDTYNGVPTILCHPCWWHLYRL